MGGYKLDRPISREGGGGLGGEGAGRREGGQGKTGGPGALSRGNWKIVRFPSLSLAPN